MADSPSPPIAAGSDLELVDSPVDEEEDWFGEGSSFDSGEDLAAALFAMAGDAPAVQEPVESAKGPAILTIDTSGFRVVESIGNRNAAAGKADKTDWSVRETSAREQSVEPRWGLRHSVQILKRTEQVMARLQRDAVEVTFSAASLAVSQSPPQRRVA
jgi:hypothetical protein